MTRVAHVIYLHGFASSPASSKAARFARELAALGVGYSCPDFNEPAFETLTITRMLDQTQQAIDAVTAPGPVALIGSSLGAFVALHAAARDRRGRIDRLILLAPALDFGQDRLRQLADSLARDRRGASGPHERARLAGCRGPRQSEIDDWRRTGRLRVFHHAYGEERDLHFALWEDVGRYDALSLNVAVPMLVYQGRQDESVSPAMVEAWARGRPNVELHMVDDEHQLSASLEEIWRDSERFLGLGGGIPAKPAPSREHRT
jgi:pimeloyl-ACP methyl ester carboxylesterase